MRMIINIMEMHLSWYSQLESSVYSIEEDLFYR